MLEIEKDIVYRVGKETFKTEEEAKKAQLRQFTDELQDEIYGQCKDGTIDAGEALFRVLVALRDMKGLSKKKLQLLIDTLE